MIISGLRTSCAITVDSLRAMKAVPSATFELEPRDRLGQCIERGCQQPRVLIVPPLTPAEHDLARQIAVAATSRMTRVIVANGRVIVRATGETQQPWRGARDEGR